MEHDICKFIPKQEYKDSIQTVHFVYETSIVSKMYKSSFYHVMIVSDGKGELKIKNQSIEVDRGDVFFLFPNVECTLTALTNDFRYMYIAFMGIRAGNAMHKLEISSSNFLFHDFDHLIPTWKTGINLGTEVSEFSSEGILLITFAAIGNGLPDEKDSKSKAKKTAVNIKNYIDDNFCDSDLSLEKISSELFYNKKYVSHIFKSEMQMGFSDYLNIVRIQHACTLIEQGMTSIKDIAAMCGFRDALYFSKMFKQKTKQTPSGYIKKEKSNS